jgi:hypothetical protein
MPWLITLYVVAGLLEGLGIGFVFVDLRDVRNRLQSYMSSPRIVNLRPAQETETALPLTIRHDPPPPVETRVQNLEDAFQQHRAQHSEDVAKLKDYARTETGEAIDYVQKVRRQRTDASGQPGVRLERPGQARIATLVARTGTAGVGPSTWRDRQRHQCVGDLVASQSA